MALCYYCQKSAGLFKSEHSECQRKFGEGQKAIAAEIQKSLVSDIRPDKHILQNLEHMAQGSFITNSDLKRKIVLQWKLEVEEFLEGELSEEKENRLDAFFDDIGFSEDEISEYVSRDSRSELAKAHVLRLVMNEQLPDFAIGGNIPVNLQKDEKIVWAFKDAKYIKDKVYRQYVGASHGISIRIAKGLYYRTSSFRGKPVESHQNEIVDSGYVIVTNKNIYFAGENTAVRVPYKKIVSFLPFDDGFGFIKDGANPKSQIFQTGEGWFAYNLITNLSHLSNSQ